MQHSLNVLKKGKTKKKSLWNVLFCPGLWGSLTHIQHHALNVWTEEKWSFAFVAATIWFSSNNMNSVMSPITSGMHHIQPRPPSSSQHALGEVPGTTEHPQSSLECMCHDGINPQPWLMLYIYNHPSQHCHHKRSAKHGARLKQFESSRLVFATRDTCSILGGFYPPPPSAAMLLRLVMDP